MTPSAQTTSQEFPAMFHTVSFHGSPKTSFHLSSSILRHIFLLCLIAIFLILYSSCCCLVTSLAQAVQMHFDKLSSSYCPLLPLCIHKPKILVYKLSVLTLDILKGVLFREELLLFILLLLLFFFLPSIRAELSKL